MKYIFYSAFVLLCLCGCTKIIDDSAPADSKLLVSVNADNGVQTKVSFGELTGGSYPYVWNAASETAGVSEFLGTARSQDVGAFAYNRIDNSHARFDFYLDRKANADSLLFSYFAVIPAPGTSGSHGWRTSEDGKIVYVLNPGIEQTPLAGAPDESTHIMYARAAQVRKTQASQLSLSFTPLVAYGKMTIKGFKSLAPGEKVQSIKVEAPQGYLMAGIQKMDISNLSKSTISGNSYVTINPKNISFNTTGFDVWFTTLPLALSSGQTFVVWVTTKIGNDSPVTYHHTVTLSKSLTFESGKVSGFNITFVPSDFQ